MDDGVGHVFLVLRRFLAGGELLFGLLLDRMGKLLAVLDSLSADLQASVHLGKFPRRVVEAVHAAPRRLEVHHVEFFV